MNPYKDNNEDYSVHETPTDVSHETGQGTLPIPDALSHILNLDGFIQTIDFVPTYKPQKFSDQIIMVTSGASTRAYMYDTKATGGGWRYTTLT